MVMRWFVFSLLLFGLTLNGLGQSDDELPMRRIPYVVDGTIKQTLDVSLPEDGEAPYPTVLLLHGSGGSTAQVTPQRRYLVEEAGYAVVSIDYREDGGIPQMMGDAFCALGWVVANAEDYGLDTSRMVALGYSLGGWQAGLLGTVEEPSRFLLDECPYELAEDSRVQGVIGYAAALYSPAWFLIDNGDDDLVVYEQVRGLPPEEWADLLGLDDEEREYLYLLPLFWLDETDPPFLLIHSQDDINVPVDVTREFALSVEAVGGDVITVIQPDGGHELRLFIQDRSPEANAAAADFLAQVFMATEIEADDSAATATPASSG